MASMSPSNVQSVGKQHKKAELIGDPTLADAILDRIVHNACKINLKGESMRKKVRLYPEGIVWVPLPVQV